MNCSELDDDGEDVFLLSFFLYLLQYDNRHDSGTGRTRLTALTAAIQKLKTKVD